MLDKIKNFFSFVKNNINGKYTQSFLVAVYALIMFKVLDLLGLVVGFLSVIGMDVCQTTNIKKIIVFFKKSFIDNKE